ncbi:Spy/CpxP family protein refolding chaperone [Halomonas sp.]|uniref:Spy/CpxP family protein refolding chaperone n=1 Tax=Halomonas sp. TaxID=1486246 RepID=UPI00298DBC4F|nr:Spy/CpxP family protein refolding chaperone [Halomonas sp.]MDW7746526.1 Spy/CpxP family protein refolding chaperone [Halomonas sp.]
MEIRKHILALGLVLALGASASGVTLAQGMPDNQPDQGSGMTKGMMSGGQGGMGPGMMGGGMMPCPMMGGAGVGMMQGMLDPEQHDEMRALMQEHRPAQFERLGRLMNLRDDLMAEMHGQRPDPEEVKSLHGRLAELHGEMMADKVRMRNAMHDLLTDEQRLQLQQATPESSVAPDDHDAHH